MPAEEGTRAAEVEKLGMTFVAIPVDGAEGVTEANSRALATALEEADQPIVVHCGSGNRVGALFAFKAYHVDGRTAEEALVIGKGAGLTRLEPVVRERLGLKAD